MVGVAVELPDVIPGPDHEYVPPPVPVNWAVVVEHVKVAVFEAPAVGEVVFWVTLTATELEQLPVKLVTAKV